MKVCVIEYVLHWNVVYNYSAGISFLLGNLGVNVGNTYLDKIFYNKLMKQF